MPSGQQWRQFYNMEPEFKYTPDNKEALAKSNKAIRIICIMVGMFIVLAIFAGINIFSSMHNNNKKDQQNTVDTSSEEAGSSVSDAAKKAASLVTIEKAGESKIPDHFRGRTDSKVVVVEYQDFTCPYCQKIEGDARSIHEQYAQKVLFIRRNFSVGHTYSSVTAQIAEAAYLVGGEDAYWQMSDKLYSDSIWMNGAYMGEEKLSKVLHNYANELGINGDKLIDSYKNASQNGIDAKLERDKQSGAELEVNGTPNWIINGQHINPTPDGIKAKLNKLIK